MIIQSKRAERGERGETIEHNPDTVFVAIWFQNGTGGIKHVLFKNSDSY